MAGMELEWLEWNWNGLNETGLAGMELEWLEWNWNGTETETQMIEKIQNKNDRNDREYTDGNTDSNTD